MPTLHVSNSASNGYSLGNDGTADGTKALPYLTIEAAITAASAGDTIKINDGTYVATTYLDINKANLVISPETDYGVTIQSGNTSRVLYLRDTGAGLTVNKVILDGEGSTANCINTPTTGGLTINGLTINGTKLINFTGIAITSIYIYNLTMSGGWEISSTGATHSALLFTVPAAGTVSISDGTVDISGISNGNGNGIVVNGGASGITCKIFDTVQTIGVSNATPTPNAIEVNGCTTTQIYNNTASFTGTTTKTSGIVVGNDTVACTQCLVYNNTMTTASAAHTTGGVYGILIGADGSGVNNDQISGVKVYDNTLVGGNHGLMFGWITGAKAWGNSSDLFTIGSIMKGTQNCWMTGNIITRSGNGGALRSKDGRGGDVFANNTHIRSSGYDNVSEYVFSDVSTTSITYANNLMYSDQNVTVWSNIEAGSAANVSVYNSNYYTTGSVAAGSWIVGASTYDTATAFNGDATATISGCSETDPSFTDVSNGDYTLASTSALLGTGYNWWAGSEVSVGFDGEPFAGIDTDIGAYQSTYGSFHPVNL